MNVQLSKALLLTLTILTLTFSPAYADVTNGNDDGPGSLRQAVSDAADGDTITISNISQINLTSEIRIKKNLTIDGGGTTISGGNTTRIFQVKIWNSVLDVTLKNMTLQNGKSTDYGGAIYNVQENLYLHDVVIKDCSVVSPGDSNSSGGAVKSTGYLEVVNCRFQNNTAQAHCETKNHSANGGAINAVMADISASHFYNNSVTNTVSTSNPTKKGSVKGGAIYLSGGGQTSTIDGCSFLENHATHEGTANGGAISISSGKDLSSVIELTNSTFLSNRAVATGGKAYGGALYFTRNATDPSSTLVSFVNCTLYGNCASGSSASNSRGGAIGYYYGDLEMVNTIVAASGDCSGSSTAGVYAHSKHDSFTATACLIETFEGLTQAQVTAGGGMVASPMLHPAMELDNGTWVMEPMGNSPVFNGGMDYLNFDQDSKTRPAHGGTDLGSLEIGELILISAVLNNDTINLSLDKNFTVDGIVLEDMSGNRTAAFNSDEFGSLSTGRLMSELGYQIWEAYLLGATQVRLVNEHNDDIASDWIPVTIANPASLEIQTTVVKVDSQVYTIDDNPAPGDNPHIQYCSNREGTPWGPLSSNTMRVVLSSKTSHGIQLSPQPFSFQLFPGNFVVDQVSSNPMTYDITLTNWNPGTFSWNETVTVQSNDPSGPKSFVLSLENWQNCWETLPELTYEVWLLGDWYETGSNFPMGEHRMTQRSDSQGTYHELRMAIHNTGDLPLVLSHLYPTITPFDSTQAELDAVLELDWTKTDNTRTVAAGARKEIYFKVRPGDHSFAFNITFNHEHTIDPDMKESVRPNIQR